MIRASDRDPKGDRVIYERVLRLRRGESIVPFTVRLQNERRVRRGINDGVEADLIVEGLGSNLDLKDDGFLSIAVFGHDTLACTCFP